MAEGLSKYNFTQTIDPNSVRNLQTNCVAVRIQQSTRHDNQISDSLISPISRSNLRQTVWFSQTMFDLLIQVMHIYYVTLPKLMVKYSSEKFKTFFIQTPFSPTDVDICDNHSQVDLTTIV